MILGQASKKTQPDAAALFYHEIVRQARSPMLYQNLGVPDTIDGRFDSIILHASLVIHFLVKQGESGQSAAQRLFDTMFRDFNHNLRQIGIGDLSMARHFRRMSEGFNGRLRSYENALNAQNNALLSAALARNIFRRDDAENITGLSNMLQYVWRQFNHIADIPPEKLLAGGLAFVPCPDQG
jgi:cytochrome b pre-mRNA-processing protein 3